MRTRILSGTIAMIVAAIVLFVGSRFLSSRTPGHAPISMTTPAPIATQAATETPAAETASSPEPSESPVPNDSTAASASAGAASGTPAAGSGNASAAAEAAAAPASSTEPSPSATASPLPTHPAEPTGLKPGWSDQTERKVGGSEADLLVRTGDINNLGFGWPAGFTPFSGKETPAHPYPCTPRPYAAPGTDRIMLGTSVTAADLKTRSGDGYAGCSTRPDNLPQAISLEVGALPEHAHVVLVQMFLDDFQAPVWHSQFQVSLNGTRIPTFEDTINQLQQTGPIGKLVTLRLLPEYEPLLRTGHVDLLIDDPTTHALDGYAVDFVRLLVNPHRFEYEVSVACTVVDAETHAPISGASVTAAQATETTHAAGTATLRGLPAGLVSVGASAVGYDSAVQLVDLPAGTPGVARFELKRHREAIDDLKQQLQKSGSVAIYGIHFDTASATLRPDSISSLQKVRELLASAPSAHWIIAGHTDKQGGADYNIALSIARAKSVVTWLGAHGIPPDRLAPKGYGATRPVADNATDAGRALNRRVEVSIVK